MTASLGEFCFNIIPWILSHLLNRQAHLTTFLVKCYYFGFMLITQFKEFFGVYWCVRPCNFRYVNESFHPWQNFQECAIVFNIYYLAFYNCMFCNSLRQYIPWMWS